MYQQGCKLMRDAFGGFQGFILKLGYSIFAVPNPFSKVVGLDLDWIDNPKKLGLIILFLTMIFDNYEY